MVENLHTSLNPSSRLDISSAILLYLSLASKKVTHRFQLRPVHHREYLSWWEIYGYLQLTSCSLLVPSPFAALLELHWLLCWCIYNYSSWYHILHLPFSFDKSTIINYDQRNKSIRHSADVSSTIQATKCWISGYSRRSWFVEFHSWNYKDCKNELLQASYQKTIFQLRVNDPDILKQCSEC